MHIVEIEDIFDCSIEKIWDLVTNLDNQLWRKGIKAIEVLDENHFIEHDTSGYSTSFVITNKFKGNIYEFDIENQNMKGHWIGKFLIINDNQVKIHFTESIEVHNKLMNMVAKSYLKKQQKQYIHDLKEVLEVKI